VWISECTSLRSRRQARAREREATETLIVVAIRCAGGAVLRACFRKQAPNLACCCGEGTVMVVRLMSHHFGN